MTHDYLTRRSFLPGSVCACCACVPLTHSFAATSVASTGSLGSDGLPSLLQLGTDPMKGIGQTVWVSRLAPSLWLHTTTAIIAEGEGVYPWLSMCETHPLTNNWATSFSIDL